MTQLITLAEPRSPEAEAYRSLRTNLAFARPGEAVRTLMVSAPAPGAGASTTLANLAVVSAQAGRRVVIVDSDLRRPALHALFGLANDVGVTTVLAGDDALDTVPLQATGVDGLLALTSGPVPPNPAELLSSGRMATLVERLAGEADLVLFDAPPVVVVTDAAVLAPQLDGVLLVLAAGRSRRDHTARARELLDKVGAQVLGVVLTGVEPDTAGFGSYGGEVS